MFNERCLTRLVYLPCSLSFSLLGRQWTIRPSSIPIVGLASFLIYAHILYICNSSMVALRKLMMNLTYISAHCLSTSLLLQYILNIEDYQAIFNRIRKIGQSMNSKLEQLTDLTLLSLVGICSLLVTSVISFVRIRSDNDAIIYLLVPTQIKVFYMVITKYLIAKRLRYIRTSDEYMSRINDTISHTRQLLQCNLKLNDRFTLLGTAFTIFTFMTGQCMCYTMYAIHVAGIKMPEALEHRIFQMNVAFFNVIVIAILISWSSTLVDDEVEEGKLELDATLTSRPCSGNQRKMILLFLMELNRTPIKLSALGLFDIDKASISSGLCIMISNLMVLIQFTR